MKIVHASDLHVGSPIAELVPYEGAPAELLRAFRPLATRLALRGLVDLCLDERATLLLIAGDLFDGHDRNYANALFFVNELLRLQEAGIRTVWVRGNHDAESRMLWHLPLPESATELGLAGPETLVLEHVGVALHGVSYGKPDVTADLSTGYPPPIPGMFNVGLLHTAAEGRPGHDPYAPCRVKKLVQRGYDYWALGHPHTPEVACLDPPVVFPGNLQGRNFRERGPRGAVVFEVRNGVAPAIERHELDVIRFENVLLGVPRASSLDDVADAVRLALGALVARSGDRPIVVRIVVEGAAAARALLSEPVGARVTAMIRAASEAAEGAAGIFVDQVWAELRSPPGGLWRVDRE